jgi:hemerythrin superfamily protein
MPTPPQLLMQDHREVEGLFEQYKQSADPSVVKQICTELKVHTEIEEEVVYPVLASDVPNGKGMKDHAEDEHTEVEEAVKQIIKLDFTGPQIDGLMQKIISGVTEHVQEEENEVFPAMEEAVDPQKMEQLGAELEKAKQATMKRVTAPGGELIDLTKDELYEMAQDKDIEGRSDMDKDQLIKALAKSS